MWTLPSISMLLPLIPACILVWQDGNVMTCMQFSSSHQQRLLASLQICPARPAWPMSASVHAETVMGDILPELPAAGGAAAQAAAVAEEDGQSEEQMRAWRARLVDLLAPGETVLDALRRMAVRSSPDQAPVSCRGTPPAPPPPPYGK